jgi:anti-anti-sigma factor
MALRTGKRCVGCNRSARSPVYLKVGGERRERSEGDVNGPGPDTRELVALSGHLDGRCSPEVRELIASHLAGHPDEDLRLDMSTVESVDLTVLRLLAAVAVRLQRDGHRLVLVGCRPSLRRVLTHGVLPRLFVVQRTPPEG